MISTNRTLVVAALLPFVFVILIALAVYVPTLSIKPQYDFLFIQNSGYYKNIIVVRDSRVTFEPTGVQTADWGVKERPEIYRYNVKDDTVRQLTIEEAMAYRLDPGPSSPDGYVVSYDYGDSSIFDLFGSSRGGHVIAKGNAKKKLTGISNINYYSSLQVIGWIK